MVWSDLHMNESRLMQRLMIARREDVVSETGFSQGLRKGYEFEFLELA